ncbi:MAG: PLDc N-terminal domain-containing protein, partial [Solobacterium sp.]|nr:PLDc N-terminal domain-containing protein [Solobacterium sp.]
MILRIISIAIVILIINRSQHLSSDLMWILLIMLFPVAGPFVYMLLGADMYISHTFRSILKKTEEAKHYYVQDPAIGEEIRKEYPVALNQYHYLSGSSNFPFYYNRSAEYYPLGDLGHPVMLEEMKKAKKFIFLEYFIIERGKMWNPMEEILKQKAAEGLDVRVLYDDIGSLMTLPATYASELEAAGVKCIPFNRINPIVGIIANHRDHRKIMVIDGKVGFSGGVNLADEYINENHKCGHWKDNVIKITGEAVWSLTVLFLTHWNALRETDADYEKFHVQPDDTTTKDGYIAPYGETPLDMELTAQNVYMNIINSATEYVHIMTPYLIIDTDMINALSLAAKRGVDVKLITPGVPDKRIIWYITQSYYRPLLKSGVKIYEYEPGFVHSKVFVSDDICCTVGTVNLDYRSL